MFLLIITALLKIAFTAWTFGMMVCGISAFPVRPLAEGGRFLGSSWYFLTDDHHRCLSRSSSWNLDVCFSSSLRVFRLISALSSHSAQTTYSGHWIFQACPPDPTIRCVSPGFYAVIGAAAMLAGVTRMTSNSRLLPLVLQEV